MLKNSLTILFALFTLLLAQSERSVIAITDVSAEGLSNIEIKMFYNRLESELVNLGQYDVTSRQEVDKILKEQKFQQAGCTDQECAAEIGRMLNADLMLLPSILYDSRSGVVSVSLKLVDVESARITTAITKDAEVQRAIDVNVLIRDYLVDLYRRDREEKGIIVTPTPAEKAVGKGKLIIKSTPVGANVILDNENRGLTPLELDGIDEGKHRLVLSYKGYERYARSTTVTADVTNTIEGELVPLTGNLSIISEPPGSEVFVNDEYKGKTPLTLQYLEVGEYFVKLTKFNYEDVLTRVTVEWNRENILKRILTPKPASVAFYSVPDGAEVFIDNRSRGKTSITGLKLELVPGKHNVKMQLKGYTPETAEIELAPNEITDLELSLPKDEPLVISSLIADPDIVEVITGTVTDIDGNVYQTVQINDQIWMAENLKVEHYRDGTAIPTGYSDSEWGNLSTGAYAVYDNNETHADTYGYLYNWYAVNDSRNIAPEGWHVPTDDEWQILVDYLGGSSVAGGKMKEEGTAHWNSPNTGATNESGFTALPGGYRYYRYYSSGYYYYMGTSGYFWSSTEYYSLGAWYRVLNSNYSGVYRSYDFSKRSGFSVRCLRTVE